MRFCTIQGGFPATSFCSLFPSLEKGLLWFGVPSVESWSCSQTVSVVFFSGVYRWYLVFSSCTSTCFKCASFIKSYLEIAFCVWRSLQNPCVEPLFHSPLKTFSSSHYSCCTNTVSSVTSLCAHERWILTHLFLLLGRLGYGSQCMSIGKSSCSDLVITGSPMTVQQLGPVLPPASQVSTACSQISPHLQRSMDVSGLSIPPSDTRSSVNFFLFST